ncbi:MAG: hypothetical protein HPY70_11360 [Firmicutes bacterium]|jgi:hypothetical protein|nr:hypothetical protein [Bacillota bacterium]
MGRVLEKLLGGDLRSIGNADEVVSDILKDPTLFDEVFYGMMNDNPLIRMRSADVIEKVSRLHPEYLKPYKVPLIKEVAKIEQQEVRWHVALLFSYLDLDDEEKQQIVEELFSWIDNSKSKIVKVNSMQALAKIGEKNKKMRPLIVNKLEEAIKNGSPAMVSRGKKLINKLKKLEGKDN